MLVTKRKKKCEQLIFVMKVICQLQCLKWKYSRAASHYLEYWIAPEKCRYSPIKCTAAVLKGACTLPLKLKKCMYSVPDSACHLKPQLELMNMTDSSRGQDLSGDLFLEKLRTEKSDTCVAATPSGYSVYGIC